jgi:hypothetical protein
LNQIAPNVAVSRNSKACNTHDSGDYNVHVHAIQNLLGRLHAFGAGRHKEKASLGVKRSFQIGRDGTTYQS